MTATHPRDDYWAGYRFTPRLIAPAEQFDIDRGQQATIDIGAVLLARAEIDRKASAQRIEAGRQEKRSEG